MRTHLRLALSLALAAPVLAACGAAQPAPRAAAPFNPALARYFDDSVDYVQDVEGLGGRVAAAWQRQVDGLARQSDLIGVARVETVLLGTDVDNSRSYRLITEIGDLVRGQAPEDRRVTLRVNEGQIGFNTVAGKEARLQSGRYVAFIKWYTDDAGGTHSHWHLTPLSEALLARVRRESGSEAAVDGEERVVRQEGAQPRGGGR